jgi:KilA-N domain
MAKKETIILVEGTEIRFYKESDDDFISLTDIARRFNERTGQLILNWMRTRSTIEYLGAWEVLHNRDFNVLNFEDIKRCCYLSNAAFSRYAKHGFIKKWR